MLINTGPYFIKTELTEKKNNNNNEILSYIAFLMNY